jgi:beta-lactamase regulating signal transducer with metallopeptidase domain
MRGWSTPPGGFSHLERRGWDAPHPLADTSTGLIGRGLLDPDPGDRQDPQPRTTATGSEAPPPAHGELGWGPFVVSVANSSVKEIAFCLWLTGSMLSLSGTGLQVLRFRRLLRYARTSPRGLQDQANRLAGRLGLKRCPAVWIVPGAVSPMVWAVGTAPCVFFPAKLLVQLDPEQQSALLAHELAHVRRRDHWVRVVELLALGLYWWHPVSWWARRELRAAEEQCCDAWAVWAVAGAARAYALALIRTAAFVSEVPLALPVVASGIGPVPHLRRRLTMVMEAKTEKALPRAGSLALVALGIPILTVLPVLGQTEQTRPAPSPAVRAGSAGKDQELPPRAADAGKAVAYIEETVPITREELGEYLIARLGAEKLELLVNKVIIDRACRQKGITVTAAEVEAALVEDYTGLGLDRASFAENLLKQRYNKTLYEWKEDVIRPRLLLAKLCRSRVTVTEDDIKKAFESHYGEKVHCRILLMPSGQEKVAFNTWEKLRKNPEDFEKEAGKQANGHLAAVQGEIKPIGRYSMNDEVEKEAFQLQPGEISRLIGTPEGPVILKCMLRLKPDASRQLDKERPVLQKEVFDKKVQQEIPKCFKELRDRAKAKLLLHKSQDARAAGLPGKGVEE